MVEFYINIYIQGTTQSTHNILLRIKTRTQPHLYLNDTKIKLEIYSNGAALLQARRRTVWQRCERPTLQLKDNSTQTCSILICEYFWYIMLKNCLCEGHTLLQYFQDFGTLHVHRPSPLFPTEFPNASEYVREFVMAVM